MDVIREQFAQLLEPTLARVELGTISRERHRFDAGRPPHVATCMSPTIGQPHGRRFSGERLTPLV
jgi:hypothetical protein